MTAVVAVLNKTGMALAADSAVTVSNSVSSQSKVFNTANKVFTLSKYHPIAIMIYSSASFLSTPWEVIIKLYRQELRQKSFDTVEDYYHDFTRFLLTSKLLNFLSKENDYIGSIALNVFEDVRNGVMDLLNTGESDIRNYFVSYEINKHLEDDKKNSLIKVILDYFNKKLSDSLQNVNNLSNLDVFKDKSKGFDSETKEYLSKIFLDSFAKYFAFIDNTSLLSNNILQLSDLVLSYLLKDIFLFGSTGLIFAGYGRKQIYPALYAIELDGIFNSKIRYKTTYDIQIDDHTDAALILFAQVDVMQTFLNGINPEMRALIIQSVQQTFEKLLIDYSNTINVILNAKLDNKVISDIQNSVINSAVLEVTNQIGDIIARSQVNPTVNALRTLSKEDLAELAENLIYLTFLKRRTSSSVESVGGAVDVAIISKGDGFIWKKRKHYFEKDLNQHFFQNYFNS